VVFSKSQVDLRRMATGTLGNGHRGSHERLSPLTAQAESGAPKEKLKHRHRRSSGTNLPPHSYSYRNHAHDSPYKVTDDDTDDEERLEMTLRYQRGKPKMKLKRLPKNHPLHRGPLTTPVLSSTTTDTDSFDFSRPATSSQVNTGLQPLQLAAPSNLWAVYPAEPHNSPDLLAADAALTTSPHQAPSNDTGPEKGDPHTSDADIESHIDDDVAVSIPAHRNGF